MIRPHAPNAMVLSSRARAAIERSADVFAVADPRQPLSGSAFASHAMIWKVKSEPNSADPRGPKAK